MLLAACSMLLGLAPSAGAQAADSASQVRIVEVSGLIDPVITDFLLSELDDAEAEGVLGVVLQMDSKGAVLDDRAFERLARRLDESSVPIAIWVGPSGSVAYGGAAELLGVADLVGVAGGSRIGDTGRLRLDDSFGEPFGEATARLADQTINAQEAIDLGISVGPLETSSVLREFVSQLPGYEAPVEGTESAIGLSQPQFRQLPLTLQLFHTVASPEVAYLCFVGGLALLIFELYTAGVGIAGAIGAFMLVMGCYGLAVLPVRTSAVVMLVLALLAFAVDIQTNIPRLYSGVGMVLFAIGTLTLYDGVSMSVITIGVGLIGAALYAYTGMPSMVRTRFSSPTIGRSWIIGEFGEATSDIDPEGTVVVRDAPWRAITNRATPLKTGDRVRVVGLHRMLLEVEPEAGGAKDYRDRG
ncbi:MAG: NfeD family protein [Acidimicrobiales bacterium]